MVGEAMVAQRECDWRWLACRWWTVMVMACMKQNLDGQNLMGVLSKKKNLMGA
jgi:hypothetical protein